jgi:excinuclease ABC subunit B
MGRAARHINGTAILYADAITDSMRRALAETERRRSKQLSYNTARGITPRGVSKRIKDIIEGVYDHEEARSQLKVAQAEARYAAMDDKALTREVKQLEKAMLEAARNLEFERAAQLRDQLRTLKERLFIGEATGEETEPGQRMTS